MNRQDLLSFLLLPGWPIAGLLIGALLPPLFSPRRRALALCLAVAGFLFYAIPFAFFCFFFAKDQLLPLHGTPFLLLASCLFSLSGTLLPFLGLAWLTHRLRRARRPRTQS